VPIPPSALPASHDDRPPGIADSRQSATAYLAAFEQALARAPAPLRHRSVDDLAEELSWLDSRATTALLAAMGSPHQAAQKILGEVAMDRLRRRWLAVGASATGIALLGLTLFVLARRRQPRCENRDTDNLIRPR
jgi:hypothetical protein